jgi:hypothetical protein
MSLDQHHFKPGRAVLHQVLMWSLPVDHDILSCPVGEIRHLYRSPKTCQHVALVTFLAAPFCGIER